jgi:DNA modification methylase
MSNVDILQGDCIQQMKTLEAKSVDTVITSPPYYGLRDYGTGTWVGGDSDCSHQRDSKSSVLTMTGHKNMNEQGHVVGDAIYKTECPKCGAIREDEQLGLEETPEEYITNMVKVFREVRRILKDEGTVWLNIGDTYAGGGRGGDPKHSKGDNSQEATMPSIKKHDIFKPKDLMMIPFRLAIALQEDGWWVRQDIIWAKPNPMPEPVKDRCVKGHEYIFLLSKNKHYYFDYEAIQEGENKRNKRSVWGVATKPYPEAHFAVFPIELIEPCVLAGCPIGGTVFDPFGGSGTTAIASIKHGRNAILTELNPEYIKIAEKRIDEFKITIGKHKEGVEWI